MKKIETKYLKNIKERQNELIKRKNLFKQIPFYFESDEELEKFLQKGYSIVYPRNFYFWENESLMLGRAINISAQINGISFKNHLNISVENLLGLLTFTKSFIKHELEKGNKNYFEIDLDFINIAMSEIANESRNNQTMENLNKFVFASLAA